MPAIKEIENTAKHSRLLKVGSQFTKPVYMPVQKSLSRTSLEGQMYRQKHAIVNQSMSRDVANIRRAKKSLRVR
jgi:hypothetical protein